LPGLVPGIPVSAADNKKDVDGRDKPGHDGNHILNRKIFALGFTRCDDYKLANVDN
jgi:hypothetical protein